MVLTFVPSVSVNVNFWPALIRTFKILHYKHTCNTQSTYYRGQFSVNASEKLSLPTYTGYSSQKQDPYLYEEKYYKSSHDCCLRRTNGLLRARRTRVLSTLSFVYFFGLQAKSPIRGQFSPTKGDFKRRKETESNKAKGNSFAELLFNRECRSFRQRSFRKRLQSVRKRVEVSSQTL